MNDDTLAARKPPTRSNSWTVMEVADWFHRCDLRAVLELFPANSNFTIANNDDYAENSPRSIQKINWCKNVIEVSWAKKFEKEERIFVWFSVRVRVIAESVFVKLWLWESFWESANCERVCEKICESVWELWLELFC